MINPVFYLPKFLIPKQTWWQKILGIKLRGMIKIVSIEEYLESDNMYKTK